MCMSRLMAMREDKTSQMQVISMVKYVADFPSVYGASNTTPRK